MIVVEGACVFFEWRIFSCVGTHSSSGSALKVQYLFSVFPAAVAVHTAILPVGDKPRA